LVALSHTPWWWLITQVASLPTIFAAALFVTLTLRLRRHGEAANAVPGRSVTTA
jgi:hypothetical protein